MSQELTRNRDRISIQRIGIFAYHGVYEEEGRLGQRHREHRRDSPQFANDLVQLLPVATAAATAGLDGLSRGW